MNAILKLVGGSLVALVACSSASSGDSGQYPEVSFPCSTPNVTYLITFTEQSGTCGPMTSQVVNTDAAGLTLATNESCQSQTTSGCTVRGTDCTWTDGGISYTKTFEITFTGDGSSASGVNTISMTGNGQSCTSTYSTSFMRQ